MSTTTQMTSSSASPLSFTVKGEQLPFLQRYSKERVCISMCLCERVSAKVLFTDFQATDKKSSPTKRWLQRSTRQVCRQCNLCLGEVSVMCESHFLYCPFENPLEGKCFCHSHLKIQLTQIIITLNPQNCTSTESFSPLLGLFWVISRVCGHVSCSRLLLSVTEASCNHMFHKKRKINLCECLFTLL